MNESEAYETWRGLFCRGYAVDKDLIFRVGQDVISRYCEKSRAYHSLAHIQHMLANIPNSGSSFELECAIWFHDVIYDPKRNDNEQQSADHFISMLGNALPDASREEIIRLIKVTAHGQHSPCSACEKLMVDLDLLILSEESSIYDHYAQAIRAEYHHVSDENYHQGRSKVLKHFLTKNIYHTDYFKHRESIAIANIQKELERMNLV